MNRNMTAVGLLMLLSVSLAMAAGAWFSGTVGPGQAGLVGPGQTGGVGPGQTNSGAGQGAMAVAAPSGMPAQGAGGGQRPSREEIIARVEALRLRLEQNPDNLDGWKMLGRSMLVLGRPADAVGAYARASQLAPNDPEVRAALRRLEDMASGSGRHPAPGDGSEQK